MIDDTVRPTPSYTVATWLAARTPDGVLRWAARAAGRVHYWLARDKRRNVANNLTQAIVVNKHMQPWRAFQHHALNILELLKATSEGESRILGRLTLQGREHIDAALAKGCGLILATFHSGNWELSGLLLAMHGYPITTVAGTQLRAGWSPHVKAFKERFGIKVVSPDGSMRTLYRDLQANRIVVLHVDGNVFSGGIEASLLGKTVTVPRGPAHLSRAVGAPAAFAYCRRTPTNHLNVHVGVPEAPPATTIEEEKLTRRFVSRLEKCVLEDPGQWCIFRKLS